MRAKKKKKCQTQTRWVFQANPNVTQIRGDLVRSSLDSRRSGQTPAIFSEKNCRIWRENVESGDLFFFQIWMLSLFQRPTRPDQLSPLPKTNSTNFSDGLSPYWVQNRPDSTCGQPYYYLSAQFVFHVDYTITLKNLANIV